ncbi:MAG: FtsX-like permease family protein [Actinobacteria bacterium]|nr:FtsX-like permease family protein [Actinomycetota bacterium]
MGRSGRARLWVRWTLRDARRRWVQVLSIALLLALGVGMYAALGSMSAWRKDSADQSFSALRMHDLRVSLADGSFARAGALRAALHRMPERDAVTVAEERLVVPAQVDASARGRTIIVPGRIVGAPVDARVDTLFVRGGRALRAGDAARPVAELEYSFARHYGLPASGTIRLTGGRTLRYVGQVQAPEYFVVTAPGADFGAEASFAVAFVPLRAAQVLTGHAGRVNELVLRTRPGTDLAALRRDLTRNLRAALPATGFAFTEASQEPARRLIEKDAEGDQQLMNIFAFLLLGAATFAAFNLISRTIEAQRREIGVGMALGVEPRALARRPLLLGAQIALLGVLLGLPVGIAGNAALGSVMETFFPLPVLTTSLRPATFAQGAALGLVLPLAATALPVWRAVRVTPIEAIRVGARAAKSSGLAWVLRGVRLPGGSLGNLPIRNVLRTPRRTLTTLLGIAAVVTIVIALAGLLDSFEATLDASRREALAGAPDRLTVDLAAPLPAGSRAVAAIAGAPSVGATQTSLRLPSTLRAGEDRVNAFVEVIESDGRLWHPTLTAGTLPATRSGLVISSRAARDLNVGVGDRVDVVHPVPTGPDSSQLVSTTLPVSGINASPFRFVAYANRAAAGSLHVAGLVSRISVVPAAGRSPEDVKHALLRLPVVTGVQGASATTDAVDQRMGQFTDVLLITVTVALLMALLIAFNSTAINADERARENATMFAYGVPTGRVTRASMIEALITGMLGTALGIAAGYGVLRWVIDTTMPTTMPDIGTLTSIGAGTYALAILTGTVIVTLAPLLTLRRLRRTDIPATLRVVE